MALGIPSPRELYSRLTSQEITDWFAFYSLDPWGGQRGDIQAAIIASTIANVNRSKDSKPMTPADFMPRFGEKPKKQTWQDQLAKVRAMSELMGIEPPPEMNEGENLG